MNNPPARSVESSRLIENALLCNGIYLEQLLDWTGDVDAAPATWLENRVALRKKHGSDPGTYFETGRIINIVTGEVIESYESAYQVPTPSVAEPVEPAPGFTLWQKAIFTALALPGFVAALACIPSAIVIYLSYKTTKKLCDLFEFWQ